MSLVRARAACRARVIAQFMMMAAGALAFAAISLLSVTRPALAQAGAPQAIGVAAPLSGPLAEAGREIVAGVGAALAGPALAKVFVDKPVIVDDPGAAREGDEAAKKLVQAGVRLVIGHYTSASADAAADVYARDNALLMAPTAIAARLTDTPGRRVFRLAAREDDAARFAVDALARMAPQGTLALAHVDAAPWRVLTKAALDRFAHSGRQAQHVSMPTDVAPDMIDRIAAAMIEENITGVYIIAGPIEGGRLVAALRRRGSSMLVLGGESFASPDLPATAGEASAGVRIVTPDEPAPSDAQACRDAAEAIARRGARATPTALASYAAVEILAQAMRTAGSADAPAIAQALRANTFASVIGPVSFDDKGDRRETLWRVETWSKARDGGFVFAPDAKPN